MNKENFTCQLVKHEEAYELAYQLAQKILKSDYLPDVVVAIARGGFPPARYVCDFLDLSELASTRIKHYEAGARKNEKTDLKNPLNAEVKDRNILVVDDVNDTGKTLEVAVKYIESLQPKNIKTAVLHEKKNTVFKADFVAAYVKEWRWITYPWAMVEDMIEFLNKSQEPVDSPEKAQQYLKKEYDIEISPDQLEKVLALKKTSPYEDA
jgi:hypoxanthine phosphoribosyltransferase